MVDCRSGVYGARVQVVAIISQLGQEHAQTLPLHLAVKIAAVIQLRTSIVREAAVRRWMELGHPGALGQPAVSRVVLVKALEIDYVTTPLQRTMETTVQDIGTRQRTALYKIAQREIILQKCPQPPPLRHQILAHKVVS